MKQIEKERNIKAEVLIDAIEAALVSAYKRNYNVNTNVRASMDPETGTIGIFASKSVVETVENPNSEISLKEAKILVLAAVATQKINSSHIHQRLIHIIIAGQMIKHH